MMTESTYRYRATLFFVAMGALVFAPIWACSSDPDPDPDSHGVRGATTVHVVAAQGGSITDKSNKMELTIPAGALAADVDITLDVSPAANGSAGDVYDFGPKGLQFLVPATLTVRADDVSVPPKKSLSIAYLDGATFSPVVGSMFDNGVASAPIAHFSKYSTLLVDGPCATNDNRDWVACFTACAREPNCPDIKVQAPQCVGGQMRVSCKGSCRAPAGASLYCGGGSCDGVCQGLCNGDPTTPGQVCVGTCTGECTGKCAAGPTSAVVCDGLCDAEFEVLCCDGGEMRWGDWFEASCPKACSPKALCQ